jgi:heme iron utilization protein
MNIPIAEVLRLLHTVDHGVLATLATQMPGYPYATVLPFALDEWHRPFFLISALAEHTKNLLADPRASFVVHLDAEGSVLAGPRATLLGKVGRFSASDRLVARYLRYQPDAQQYLALNDFAFFRLQIERLRAIAGFGAMGWLEAETLQDTAWLSLEDEAALLLEASLTPGAAVELLGVDPYGIDLLRNGTRERRAFPEGPLQRDAIKQALQRMLQEQ